MSDLSLDFRIVMISQDEFSKSDELNDICSEIYLNKFYREFEFSLDGISNLFFFLYYLNDEVIGFGTYQENSTFFLIDSIFVDDYIYSDRHKYLVNIILKEVNLITTDKIVCLYQSDQEDCDFYLGLGFNLYKDYEVQSPGMFEPGFDQTRFVLEKLK
jgi:hypothetical protein